MGFLFKDEEKERDEEQRKALRRGTAPDMEALDFPKAIKRGAYNTAAGIAGAKQYVQGKLGNKAAVEGAELDQRQMELNARKTETTMSPGGRAMVNAPVLPDGENYTKFGTHPFDALFSIAADQTANIFLFAAPSGALGKLTLRYAASQTAAKAVAVGTVSATSAVLGTGQVVQEIKDAYKNLSDEELAEQSLTFRKLLEDGVDPKQARKDSEALAIDHGGDIAAILNAALGPLGIEAGVAKRLAGGATAGGGFVKRVGKAVAKEDIQEFTQEAGQGAIADWSVGGADNIKLQKNLRVGLEAAAQATALALPLGAASNIGPRKPRIPIIPSVAPGLDQEVAVQGAPLPPTQPVKTPPTPPAVNVKPPVGPPVVSAGAHTPPPSVKPPAKDMRKKKATTGVVVTDPSAIPDAAMVKALEETTQAPPPQEAPLFDATIQPPVIPEGTPRRAREFMEQQQVLPPLTPAAPAPAPVIPQAAPIEEQPVPVQEATPLPPPPAVPPAPVEVVPPQSTAAKILPDLKAKQEFQAKVAAPSQGTRYELGVNPEEVEDFPMHQAWRRKMVIEARGTSDPLNARDGDWRDADITVSTNEGTATVKAGPAIDYQAKRIKSLRELLDCVNAS